MISIDRNYIYKIDIYSFKNFTALTADEQKTVWIWRNDDRIRQWMYDKTVIPFEKHLNFILKLNQRTDAYYWLVYKKDIPLGVFSIVNINSNGDEAEPGYYLNPDFLNTGEGLFFNYYYRFFIHNILGLNIVKGYVACGNSRAYTMSSFFGVKAISLTELSGTKYLEMKGKVQDFNQVSKVTLLKDFVKYSKALNIEWVSIIEEFINE